MHILILFEYNVEIRENYIGHCTPVAASLPAQNHRCPKDYEVVLVLKEIDCLCPSDQNCHPINEMKALVHNRFKPFNTFFFIF